MRKMLLFMAGFMAGMLGTIGAASAYLDPGTGSMILQGIIGTIAAGAAIFGIYWHRMKSHFSGKNDMKPAQKDEVETNIGEKD